MRISVMPMQTEEDMDGKAYVHWKSWHETYTGIVDAEFLPDFSLEKCRGMARRWPDNTLLAKTEDGNVIGFLAYGKTRDADMENCGEIFAIYVLRAYQKRRVGYRLMNAGLEKLRDYGKTVVWALKENEPAIRFYGRYGFARDGAEKEIVLGKPLIELRLVISRKA